MRTNKEVLTEISLTEDMHDNPAYWAEKYIALEAKLAAAEAEIATLRDTLVLIDNRCYQDEWVVATIAAAMAGAGR